MSIPASAEPVGAAHEGPPGITPSKTELKARSIGLTSATGLVIGSIIGTGIFAMPAVLAGAGTSSLVTLAVIGVGAMLLAVMFGQLIRRVPKARPCSGAANGLDYPPREPGPFVPNVPPGKTVA